MKSKELKKFWNRFFKFKIGDRVKIIDSSAYAIRDMTKYIGKRGVITGIYSTPENERFFIVRVLDSNLPIDEFLAREEDLEHDVEGNGSSLIRDSHLQRRDSLCGSPK